MLLNVMTQNTKKLINCWMLEYVRRVSVLAVGCGHSTAVANSVRDCIKINKKENYVPTGFTFNPVRVFSSKHRPENLSVTLQVIDIWVTGHRSP
jgi:hypothetical protein